MSTNRPLRVALIGGGIGGLTAALALARAGHEARVFEQAGQLREVGAGIGVGPNAVKVLRALGLEEALKARAFEAEQIEGRNWATAEPMFRVPMKGDSLSRYGAGHFQIHRADLLEILAEAVGEGHIELNARCIAVASSEQAATVTLDNGRQEQFDVVVGCDGLHSVVRAALHGPDAPRFTNNMCWRALIPTTKLPPHHVLPQMTVWIGQGGHVVTYYIRGGEMVNLVAFHDAPDWIEESWSIGSSAAELAAAYPGVHDDLRTLLHRSESCFKWGLFDRDPLPVWSRGRITLLGDAAHPMLPFLGQGAATAIEDGYVLAQELARSPDDIAAAFRGYEAQRIPRTSRIQLAARHQERFIHHSDRSAALNSDWLYEFDVTR